MVFEIIIDPIREGLAWLRMWLTKTYEVALEYFNKIIQYIQILTSTFPFDKPQKTLMLSVVFFAVVVGIVLLFSSTPWKTTGVGELESMKFNIYGRGDNSLDGGGDRGGQEEEQQEGATVMCNVDADCQQAPDGFEGDIVADIQCCTPELFEGYACKGICLRGSYPKEACKHPNSCQWRDIRSEREHFVKLINRCDVDPDTGLNVPVNRRDAICKSRGGGTSGYNGDAICCNEGVCMNYCSSTGNCYDWTSCPEENQLMVKLIEGGDIQ
jgi:hypothetical protein